jgi:hypothetical protein
MRLAQGRRDDEVGHLSPQGLIAREAERVLGGRVPLANAPVGVHADDGIQGSAHDAVLDRFRDAHGLVSAAALGVLADLTAKRLHEVQKLAVGLRAALGQELHDAERLVAADDGKREPALQAAVRGGLPTQEARVTGEVVHPDRLAGAQRLAGKAGVRGQDHLDVGPSQWSGPLRVGLPHALAAQESVPVERPQRPELPSAVSGDGHQDVVGGGAQRLRAGQDADHLLQQVRGTGG